MGFQMRYLGLNSYEFETEGGVRIVADPTFSRPWKKTPVDRESYPPPDVIFLTHGDPSDHVYEVPTFDDRHGRDLYSFSDRL